MTYIINGKQYTEFDINKTCSEIRGLDLSGVNEDNYWTYGIPMPCTNPLDTWQIIEKCWDELMDVNHGNYQTEWSNIIDKHNCSKLVAACICFIEANEGKS